MTGDYWIRRKKLPMRVLFARATILSSIRCLRALHDEKGIIWPKEVAPFHVHLLELGSEKPNIRNEAEKIYRNLQDNEVEILYDDREETSAGEKMADADLIGIPLRVVISEKSLAKGGVEIKKRPEPQTEIIPAGELLSRTIN